MMLARLLRFPWLRLYCFLFFLLFSRVAGAQDAIFSAVASTCSNANGSITVQVLFGSGPWLFSIDAQAYVSNGTDTYVFDGLVGAATGRPYSFDIQDLGSGVTKSFSNIELGDLGGPTIGPSLLPFPASCLNNDGSLVITQTGGNEPFVYSIDGINFSSNPSFTNLPAGTVSATVRDFNGCLSSMPVVVPLNNDLTIAVDITPQICAGQNIKVPVQSTGTSFSWSPAIGLSDPTVLDPIASPTVTTDYIVTANRGICPAVSAPVIIVVNPVPVADAGPDVFTCYNKTVLLHGSGGQTYQWTPSFGLVNPAAPAAIVERPDNTITYALFVTDANGCTSLQPDSTTVFVTPPLNLLAGPDTIVSIGQPVQLYAMYPGDPGGSTFQWFPAFGLSDPSIPNPVGIFNAPEEVSYVVKVTSSIGCTEMDTVVIKALAVTDIIVPNAFSPNNDGHNDVLRAIAPGIKTLKYFTVFDRWGRQVFSSSNVGVGWDGTVKGQVMETGVYVWMAMGEDFNGKVVQRKGTVVLVK